MGGKWKGRVCRQSRMKGEGQKEAWGVKATWATKAERTGHPSHYTKGKADGRGEALGPVSDD